MVVMSRYMHCATPKYTRRYASLVCLSTPFLHVRARVLGTVLDRVLRTALAGFAFVLTPILFALVYDSGLVTLPSETGPWDPFVWPPAITGLALALWINQWLKNKRAARASEIAQRFSLPSSEDILPPVLILRAP